MNMPSSQTLPAVLYSVAAVLGAVGQYFYKRGGQAKLPLLRNLDLFLGIGAFCLVMVLFVAAYRLGGRISFVYPFYATTFLWGTLIGIMIDKEPWSPLQLGGILVMIGGIALMAAGAPR
jgi:drug/metabolite transporter (DMT)-like permease